MSGDSDMAEVRSDAPAAGAREPVGASEPGAEAGGPGTGAGVEEALRVSRWTATSGSNARSRGAVVIASGDHEWRASAEGIGAIDALYRAVDQALAGVLTGHPRLLAYDIHALGEGTDTIGAVTVRIAPPDIGGERGSGEYRGEARGPNIIAASIEAYISALNSLLAESHWSGATEAAGNRRGVAISAGKAREQRADIDESDARHDTTAWFER